jgi:mannose-6-phosphate isomerase-like protein (cupin superfamily)
MLALPEQKMGASAAYTLKQEQWRGRAGTVSIVCYAAKALIANGGKQAKVAAGSATTISRGVHHACCNPSRGTPRY